MLLVDASYRNAAYRLVPFSGGHFSLFSFPIRRFLFRKGCSTTKMLPAKEAWRISLAKGYSPECVEGEFSEVRALLCCCVALTALEQILFASIGVYCVRCVASGGHVKAQERYPPSS